MTSRDAIASLEDTELEFGSLSERLIYLYLRFHADRKSVVRLSMAELAAQLGVNRQTVVKHVDALKERHLVTRQGHGRYRVHAEPWSLRNFAKAMLDELKDGDVFDVNEMARRAYGEPPDWAGDDPRAEEVLEYQLRLERAGIIWTDEYTGTVYKGKRKAS
jgi:DNA-binding transcriptional ArsR family regulator